MKNGVCHLQTSHLQEVFFRACLCCISSSYLLYVFRMKMHKIPFPPGDKGTCHTTSWMFQSQSNLIWCWACSNGPWTALSWAWQNTHCRKGSCSRNTRAQGLCMWILHYICMMWWIPWVISGRVALAEKGLAACLVWCAPTEALKPAGGSICFPLPEPCYSLTLAQKCSLGPSRLSLEGLKVLQKPSKGYESRLWWKHEVTGVCLDRKCCAGRQDHAEGISCPGFLVSIA